MHFWDIISEDPNQLRSSDIQIYVDRSAAIWNDVIAQIKLLDIDGDQVVSTKDLDFMRNELKDVVTPHSTPST